MRLISMPRRCERNETIETLRCVDSQVVTLRRGLSGGDRGRSEALQPQRRICASISSLSLLCSLYNLYILYLHSSLFSILCAQFYFCPILCSQFYPQFSVTFSIFFFFFLFAVSGGCSGWRRTSEHRSRMISAPRFERCPPQAIQLTLDRNHKAQQTHWNDLFSHFGFSSTEPNFSASLSSCHPTF